MNYGHFREIVNEFPQYKSMLINHTYSYKDPNRKFLKNVLEKVDILKESLTLQSMNHLFYTLKWVDYDEGEYIYKEYDHADNIVIITNGLAEVYTHFEGNKFVFEYLTVGSVINYNNFFLEELVYTNIRCITRTKVQILTREGFDFICSEHEHFKTNNHKYIMKLLKQNRPNPLDYIITLPFHQ